MDIKVCMNHGNSSKILKHKKKHTGRHETFVVRRIGSCVSARIVERTLRGSLVAHLSSNLSVLVVLLLLSVLILLPVASLSLSIRHRCHCFTRSHFLKIRINKLADKNKWA